MSIGQKLCNVKLFQLQSILNVSSNGLSSKILVFRFWPWYSTWTILERQSCTLKNRSQVAKYNNIPFFRSTVTNLLHSGQGALKWVGWLRFDSCRVLKLSAALGHFAWDWARQCTELCAFILVCSLSLSFLSWILSVVISRWQSCKS